tara:strand:+ start:233 stop:529 length:297 start_codon:yes stop_codon:yes gene_type:complete
MKRKNKIYFLFLFFLFLASGLLILLDVIYQDYSFAKNKELKNLIITKEKELILLKEQNENLKNNINLLRKNQENENDEILDKEKFLELDELETNEDPN